jgi:Mg2+/Co2+ transporter CorB
VTFLGNNKSTVSGRYIFSVALGSFFLAVIFTLISELVASRLNSILLSFIFLTIIILLNIFADIVGTAVTVASHVPFNAKASKRITGAPQGLQLIRNADRVANIANDVIGDITTTVSGALGISIVVQIMRLWQRADQFWLNILMTALISVIIVSGKAAGKKVAVSRSEDVIFLVGKLLAALDDLTGLSPFRKRRGSKNKQKVGRP